MSNNNNKKVLAEKLKNHLNSLEYVAIPDLIRSGDCSPALTYYDGEHILQKRKFIDFEKELNLIYYDQLEPNDWTEIINLIKKRNQEREQNYQAKKKEIEDKVNSQPGLFYYYGSGSKDDRSNSSIGYGDKQGRYFGLWGSENGRSFYLNINANHPVLNNFPFGNHGYYLIETDKPIERNDGKIRPWSDGGENNASNFHKWVEVGDKIAITPYEVTDTPTKNGRQKGSCDTCQKKLGSDYGGSDEFYIIKRYHGKVNIDGPVIWACQDCYPAKEREYLQNYETVWKRYLDKNNEVDYHQIKFSFIDCYADKKDPSGKVLKQENCSHCQPWKQSKNSNSQKSEKEIINWLIQYFQANGIKEITAESNGNLKVTHNNNNNNKIVSTNHNSELQNVENYLAKSNDKTLKLEELKKLLDDSNQSQNSTPNSPKTDYVPWIIGGLMVAGLLVAGYYCLQKNRNKKDK